MAWRILFFGLLLTWHGLVLECFLTLSIAAGIAGSTVLTCGVGVAALARLSAGMADDGGGGSTPLGVLCGSLAACAAASVYLCGRTLEKLREISRG